MNWGLLVRTSATEAVSKLVQKRLFVKFWVEETGSTGQPVLRGCIVWVQMQWAKFRLSEN